MVLFSLRLTYISYYGKANIYISERRRTMDEQMRIFELESKVRLLDMKVNGLLDLFKTHIEGDEIFRQKVVQTFEAFAAEEEES